MKTQLQAIVIIIVLFVSWILLEQTYMRAVLQEMSVQHIQFFRNLATRQQAYDILFEFASQMGDKYGILGCIWISIHFQNQAHAFIIGVLSSLCLLISQTVKSMLREPRPFMISDQIEVHGCSYIEFGNPSSHTFLSSAMYITTVYLFYRHYTYKFKIKQSLVHLLFLINTLFIAIYFIGFSRVFKGVHSYNQIISGHIQGVLISLLPSFILYKDLFKFYLTLKHRPLVSVLINRYTFIFIVLIGLSFHIHWDTQTNFKVPQDWTSNILRLCPKLQVKDINPEAVNFRKLLQTFQIIGTYMGAVFEQQFLDSRRYSHFQETSVFTSVQRLLLCLTLAMPTQYIKDIPKYLQQDTKENVVLFKYILMPMVQGFVLFAFSKSVSIHFGLANLRESEETVAGHDKELLSIMSGTEIQSEMYKHNQGDSQCKHNKLPNGKGPVRNGKHKND